MDTKGKSFLNAAPPIPSYERFQMSNVIETHKFDVWVHLWWALVWHKNLNFNNFVPVNSFIYNTQIFFWRERLIFSCFDTHFAEIIVLTKKFSGYLEIFTLFFVGILDEFVGKYLDHPIQQPILNIQIRIFTIFLPIT